MHQQDLTGTKRLYYEDSEMKTFSSAVLSCAAGRDGAWELELSQTAFFAAGGGQDGDRGFIEMPDGRRLDVSDTIERGGVIYHIVPERVEPGAQVKGTIDWELRFERMQQHSAEHIVSGLVLKLYGLDNVGFRLTDVKTTLDFNGPLGPEDLARVERLANEAVYANVPFNTFFPTKEEEAALNYRSKISIDGQVRLVEVPGYDLCACCAPHVKSSAQIGVIKIVDAVSYKGGVRLTIKCGLRALRDYGEALASLGSLGEKLSSPREELGSRVDNLKAELAASLFEEQRWQAALLEKETPQTLCGRGLLIVQKMNADVVRRFVSARQDAGTMAVFFGSDGEGYSYIAGSASEDLRTLSAAINAALGGRGGGKPAMVQGSVRACADEIRAFFGGDCK